MLRLRDTHFFTIASAASAFRQHAGSFYIFLSAGITEPTDIDATPLNYGLPRRRYRTHISPHLIVTTFIFAARHAIPEFTVLLLKFPTLLI